MSEPSQTGKPWLISALIVAALAVGIGVFLQVKSITPEGPDEEQTPGFREMAREAGIDFHMDFLEGEQGEKFKINLYDHGCGVAVADYDGDGHDDIYFVNQLGPNALYHNNGDGTFTDVTNKAGVGIGNIICVGATFADTLNKGHQDLFVTSTRGGNKFFRNQGDGTFKDATKDAHLEYVGHSQTAVFFDFNNDGYLDLLLINSAEWTTNHYDKENHYFRGKDLFQDRAGHTEFNILYRNNRDGTFTDVTEKSGLKGRGWGGDVAVFDYNGDGKLDVLITNMFGPSQLYRNNGDGSFSDVTRETLGPTPYGSIGAKVFDFNNDGKLDLLIVDMHSDMWMNKDASPETLKLAREWEKKKYSHITGPTREGGSLAKAIEMDRLTAAAGGYKPDDVVYGNTLFKNLGGGKFQEVSDQANMENFWPWGIATGDFDNDGFEDAFIPTGMGYPFFHWPNYLMMNNGNETFTDRAHQEGIEPPPGGIYLDEKIGGKACPRSSRCAASADFDGDGRLDIVVNNFNDRPYYFRNQFPRKNYIAFRLRGTKSNRDAIGALVTLQIGDKVMVRQVNPAGGYLSQSSKTVHFGLGDHTRVDRAEILWPSGIRQKIESPAINKLHSEVVEKGK